MEGAVRSPITCITQYTSPKDFDTSPVSDGYVLPGQFRPALGPSPVNNSPTLLGRHAFQKPMVSGPLDSAGLKCSFHFKFPYL